MLNGQGRLADRERVARYAKATGQKEYDVQEDMDTRDYSSKNASQPKLYRENSGQHYPGFLDRETKTPVVGAVKFTKPKAKSSLGHQISDTRYQEELDAQRKRAQTDDGVPEDVLKGAAAAKRKRERESTLNRDNTLELLKQEGAESTMAALQQKLLSVQRQLRHAGNSLKQGAPIGTMGGAHVATSAGPAVTHAAPLIHHALPPGWRALQHASSKQTYYLSDTGEKRWSPPHHSGAKSDIPGRADAAGQKPSGAPAASSASSSSSTGGAKKQKKEQVDPMDPCGESGGRWTEGFHHKGERMADSTASGPLWQQRPYPAPSDVLRMRGPGVREGSSSSSIGPSLPSPAASHGPHGPPKAALAFQPRAARRPPLPPPRPPPK